jgi:hypothetical protein
MATGFAVRIGADHKTMAVGNPKIARCDLVFAAVCSFAFFAIALDGLCIGLFDFVVYENSA